MLYWFRMEASVGDCLSSGCHLKRTVPLLFPFSIVRTVFFIRGGTRALGNGAIIGNDGDFFLGGVSRSDVRGIDGRLVATVTIKVPMLRSDIRCCEYHSGKTAADVLLPRPSPSCLRLRTPHP